MLMERFQFFLRMKMINSSYFKSGRKLELKAISLSSVLLLRAGEFLVFKSLA